MNEEEEDESQRKWEDEEEEDENPKKMKSDGFSDVEWEEEDENPKKRKSDGFSDVEWEEEDENPKKMKSDGFSDVEWEEEDENPKKMKSDGFSDVEWEDEKEEPKLIFVIDTHGHILEENKDGQILEEKDKIIDPTLYNNITIFKKNIVCCGELCFRVDRDYFQYILDELKVSSFHTCAPKKEHEIVRQIRRGRRSIEPIIKNNPLLQNPLHFSRSNGPGVNRYDPCQIHEIKRGCNKVYNKKFTIDEKGTGIYIQVQNTVYNLFIIEDLRNFLNRTINNAEAITDFVNKIIAGEGRILDIHISKFQFLLTSDLVEICKLINLYNNEIKVFGIIDSSCMVLNMSDAPEEFLDDDTGTKHFDRAEDILREGAKYGGINKNEKRNKSKRNKSKRNKSKRNKSKRNKSKRNKSKRNKSKRNKSKRNKSKRNNINKNSSSLG
jgi:hypothetical protein